jgi:hypothetical protein
MFLSNRDETSGRDGVALAAGYSDSGSALQISRNVDKWCLLLPGCQFEILQSLHLAVLQLKSFGNTPVVRASFGGYHICCFVYYIVVVRVILTYPLELCVKDSSTLNWQ